MLSLHLTITLQLAAAAALMPGGLADAAACPAAEIWEQHEVIRPTPLVAEAQSRAVAADSNRFTSLAGLSQPFVAAAAAFPLSWPKARLHPSFGRPRKHPGPSPVLLKFLFDRTDSGGDGEAAKTEWWSAWDDSAERPTEWSPLKLTFPAVADRAVPAELVPRATIEVGEEWYRFRFILPNETKAKFPAEIESVTFDLVEMFREGPASWSDELRVYTFSVVLTEPRPAKPIVIRHSSWNHGYAVVNVDSKKFEEQLQEESGAEESHFEPLMFDEWLGSDEQDATMCCCEGFWIDR